jgi:hypothetical protein
MGRRAGMRLNTTRLFCTRRSFFSMYFSDSKGNKVDPATLGIEQAIDGAYDVTISEDLGNGQTKLTFIGSEPMASAKNSGQMEGWIEILDKLAEVVAGLARAE